VKSAQRCAGAVVFALGVPCGHRVSWRTTPGSSPILALWFQEKWLSSAQRNGHPFFLRFVVPRLPRTSHGSLFLFESNIRMTYVYLEYIGNKKVLLATTRGTLDT